MAESGGCCRCCISFIFSSGLTALFLWLSLRTSAPNFSIEKFYIPALNISANDPNDTSISFDLTLTNTNTNKDKGVYYDALDLQLFYGHDLTVPIANVTIPGFRQGHKKKAYRSKNVSTVGVPVEEAKTEIANLKETVFRVTLATAVRYRIIFWKTKHHKISVGGNVTVNGQGTKSTKKGFKLSGASVHAGYGVHRGLLGVFILFSFWL